MSEAPRRAVQGFERKPSTLATVGRREGGGRGKSLLHVDLLKVSDRCLRAPWLHTRTSEDCGDRVPCAQAQGIWDCFELKRAALIPAAGAWPCLSPGP